MGIPKRMMVTIAGLGFAGATALMIGVAAPASAVASATPVSSTVAAAPTWWDNWGCGGCWDDCWDDCDCWW